MTTKAALCPAGDEEESASPKASTLTPTLSLPGRGSRLERQSEAAEGTALQGSSLKVCALCGAKGWVLKQVQHDTEGCALPRETRGKVHHPRLQPSPQPSPFQGEGVGWSGSPMWRKLPHSKARRLRFAGSAALHRWVLKQVQHDTESCDLPSGDEGESASSKASTLTPALSLPGRGSRLERQSEAAEVTALQGASLKVCALCGAKGWVLKQVQHDTEGCALPRETRGKVHHPRLQPSPQPSPFQGEGVGGAAVRGGGSYRTPRLVA